MADKPFSDRLAEGSWAAPVAELIGAIPVSFGEGKAVFERPVFEEKRTATAQVVHRGRTVGMVECEVVNAGGKTVARASSTCSVLRGEAAKGR